MPSHILGVSIPAWGHTRPLLALAVRLVLERDDIVLTIIVPSLMLDKSFSDLELQFASIESKSAAARIRVLSTLLINPTDPWLDILAKSAEAYFPAYKLLVAGEAVTCAVKGTVFDAIPPPIAIIMDFFALDTLRATRSITGDTVPVTAIVASAAAPLIHILGPEKLGGFGDIGAKIDAEVARTGRDPIKVGEEIFLSAKGIVSKVAGLPDMYDYEEFPQNFEPTTPVSSMVRIVYSFLENADGLILTTSKAFEISGSFKALREYRQQKNQVTYAIGPLLPLHYSMGKISHRGDEELAFFLTDKVERFGEKSVLFMSFGTIVWPRSLDYVEEVIECMIEKKLPFIFCYAFPGVELPETLKAKVEASGLGLLSKWAPQQYILTHPATGWYLTHCGWGGVTEAIGAGVPMIAWPFQGDQPDHAIHLSENLKVAIELVQVRTGKHGMKPLLRNGRAAKGTRVAVREEFLGVIDDIRGARGAEIRANVERLQGQYSKAWGEQGDAKLELQAFLKKFVPQDHKM